MQIGNLSQAPLRSRGIIAFQMLRVLIVTGLVAAGGFALSLSVEDQDTGLEAVAAVERNDVASTSHVAGQSDQAAPVQVADADADAVLTTDSSVPRAADGQGAIQENVRAQTPGDVNAGQTTAMRVDTHVSAQAHETGQASTAEPPQPEMTGAVNVASISSDAAQTGDLIDLNTASFEQLNSLRNAGALGRAIIKGRPYASVEDLVKRKVIRRAVYEKIKDQVTVR